MEQNITNALLFSIDFLKSMLENGLNEVKYIFKLSTILMEKFDITQEQSTIVLENSFKLI